jgi:hypothetical protein
MLRFAFALQIGALTSGLLACAKEKPVDGAPTTGVTIPVDSVDLARARRDRDQWIAARRDSTAKPSERVLLDFLGIQHVLGVQETLAELGYQVAFTGEMDETTRSALRRFEQRHNLPSTDDPQTPEVAAALSVLGARLSNTFGLPPLSVWVDGWTNKDAAIRAQGTWWRGDPPRQTSEIWCHRADMTCRETVAYVVAGELYANNLEYSIERWDNDALTARSEALCVSDVLTINRASKTASLVRGSRNGQLETCRLQRTKWDDAVQRLADGHEVVDSLTAETLPYILLGPRVTSSLEKVKAISRH